MRLLKFFQYAYLAIAVLFFYKGFTQWELNRNQAYLSIGLAILAIFMFFFRRKYANRFKDRGKL